MSTNTNKYGANPDHFRDLLVAPITAIDTPIETSYFSYLDENEVTQYHSVKSHEVANGRKIKYTSDGLYFYYGLETSDLKNDIKDLKTFVKANGLVAGTDDFTLMVGNEFWILSADELDEWLAVSPHNVEAV